MGTHNDPHGHYAERVRLTKALRDHDAEIANYQGDDAGRRDLGLAAVNTKARLDRLGGPVPVST